MFNKYFSETFKRGLKRKICRTKDKALRFFSRSFMKTRIKTGELKRQIVRIPRSIEHGRTWLKAVITDHYNGFKANAVEVIHAGKAEVRQAMSTTKGKGKVIGVAAPAAGILLVCIFFVATAPYGITADGEKVEQPWVVKAGKEEVVVVEDKQDGQKVIEKVKEHYYSREAEVKEVVIEPGVDVDTKELERFEDPVKVSDVDKAVETIVKANEGEDPVMVVSTVEEVVNEKEISYDTEVKKSSKYEEGTVKVAEEGEKGVKEVTSIVKKENGEVIDSKVIGEKVTKKPEAKVVIKGTKISKTGAKVASYALQFVGNPYVWGGTSLTNGADCSGFTLSVYSHFGISLPHSAAAQRSYGKAVSYGDARPGDLFFYPHHVAIYIGGGQIVHASTSSTGIIVGNAGYRPISCIRRLL